MDGKGMQLSNKVHMQGWTIWTGVTKSKNKELTQLL